MANHPWFNSRMLIVSLLLIVIYLPVMSFGYFVMDIPFEYLVIGTFFVIFFHYIIGKRRALSQSNVQDIPEKQDWILDDTKELAEAMGVSNPKVYFGELNGPNAFAIGRKGKGAIVISPYLVQILEREELKGVIAHELSHLKSRDTIPTVIGEGIASVLYLFLHIILSLIPDPSKRGRTDPVGEYIAIKAHNFVMIVIFAVSRQREFVADKDSKEALSSGSPLANALIKISKVYNDTKSGSPPKEVETLCISNAFSTAKLKSTHPGLQERIDRLLDRN